MYKYKKIIIKLITLMYLIITSIEFIKYLYTDSNIYGLIYLLISIFITFLLITVSLNYNKYYSFARNSKLIISIIIGLFSSFILNIIVFKRIDYIDSSSIYIKKIIIEKNILKPILYFLILIFTLFEYKLDKLVSKKIKGKNLNTGIS